MIFKIKNFLMSLNKFYKIGLVFLILILAFFFFKGDEKKQTVSVVRGDISEEVRATGNVEANQSADLGFDKSGRVGFVYVKVGDIVKKGDLLSNIESGDQTAELSKARAVLRSEQIKFQEIKNTTPVSYSGAYRNLEASIREAFSSADDAVRNKSDQFFKNNSNNPYFEVSFSDGNFVHYFKIPNDTVLELNSERKKIESLLLKWQTSINLINENNVLDEAVLTTKYLSEISSFMDKMAYAINSFAPAEFEYETTVNKYKSDVYSARSSISTAISDVITAKDKLNNIKNYGDLEHQDILIQETKVKEAEANVDSILASLSKYSIRAPFDGVITSQNAKVGQAVSLGEKLISIISQNDFYVESNISEINIGKLNLNDKVIVNFDAYPEEIFEGFVSSIEPAEIVIDGVVNYKIKVSFASKNLGDKIKSGLTANLKIKTAEVSNVLKLPVYVIKKEKVDNQEKSFVFKIDKENNKEKVVIETGLLGNDSMIEIKSNLEEGNVVEY